MKKELWMRMITESRNRKMTAYIPRDLVVPLDSNKIISIIGSRRSGKTTYLLHIMDQLKSSQIPAENIIYINLENPSLLPYQSTNLIELMEAYHSLYPALLKEKKYIFLDEIQLIPDWEIAVRHLYDQENCQIWLSGSTSHLLSRDISTHLRGRSISYTLYPFSFREILRYHQVKIDDPTLPYSEQRFFIQRLFDQYLHFGGYPEVISAGDEDEKKRILQEYLETIFFRDLIERYRLRNLPLMRDLIRFLFTNIGSRFSLESYFRSIKQNYPASKQTLIYYLQYLEDVFLFFPVKKYAFSLKEQAKSFKKIYAIDLGLQGIGSFELLPTKSHRLENAVYNDFLQRASRNPFLEIYYDRQTNDQEVDFLVKEGSSVKSLIQVCFTLGSEKTFNREIRSLLLAKEKYNPENMYIITEDEDDTAFCCPKDIRIVPFWKWAIDTTI